MAMCPKQQIRFTNYLHNYSEAFLLTRIIVGIGILAALAAVMGAGGWVFAVTVAVIGVFCQYEMIKMLKTDGSKVVEPVSFAYAIMLLPTYWFFGLKGIIWIFGIAVFLTFIFIILSQKYDFNSLTYTMLTLIYPQFFLVFLYMIVLFYDSSMTRLLIAVTVGAVALSDALAYFIGSWKGKHKLAPQLSPKKSVEGAIAGLFGGMGGAVLMAVCFDNGRFHLWVYLILGLVLAVVGMFGDLAASFIKRRFNQKDFGTILPGHGGVLDRIDSILFALPVVYMFYVLFC